MNGDTSEPLAPPPPPVVQQEEEEDDDDTERHDDFFVPLIHHGSSLLPNVASTQDAKSLEAAAVAARELNNLVRTPVSSRPSSRAPSPTSTDDDVPTNVSDISQLSDLPDECLSGDPIRPLQHFDESGVVFKYALSPMLYSAIFVLAVETIERLAFYGLNYTQTSYLTGTYNSNWNAGMMAIPASSYVSVSVAVAYTTPFLGAFLADQLLGDYWSILCGCILFYLPGLLLIALTTVPGFLGDDFNMTALSVGLLFLWPTGTGVVKSIVNVFGAKQFHPLLQSSLIEAYYVKFYMCINIGALIGGIAIPVVAQTNVTTAYFLPVIMLSLAVALFAAGTPRYVRNHPNPFDWKAVCLGKKKKKKTLTYTTTQNTETIPLGAILRVSLLIVPFCIAYSQMATTFIVQGTVMQKAFGYIDAASMNNADAIAVLFFGYFIGSVFYPWCASRSIKIPTTYKFAIGSALGAAAIAWALMVELMIHYEYEQTGGKVNILWQAMAYILIGAGEIFAVSAAYECAFTASPPEKKVLASAVNLFCIGGLPNVICIFLYQTCSPWFQNQYGTTKISHISDYTTAHVAKYFWLLFFISIGGVLLNLLPAVREYVESIEARATDMIRTPKTPVRPPRREPLPDEETALLRIKRHQYYLKYGSGPQLYKSGSMRAGPSMSHSVRNVKGEQKHLKRTVLSNLYRSDPVLPGIGTIMGTDRSPVVGVLLKKPTLPPRAEGGLERSSSD